MEWLDAFLNVATDFMRNVGILSNETWPNYDVTYDYDESVSFLSDDNYILRWFI